MIMDRFDTSLDIVKDLTKEDRASQILTTIPVKKVPIHEDKGSVKKDKHKKRTNTVDLKTLTEKKGYSRKVVFWLIIIALMTCLLVHVYQADIPGLDDIAERNTYDKVIKNIAAKVGRDYAARGLPDNFAQIELRQQVDAALKSEGVKREIKSLAESYRDIYRDTSSVDYLKGADSYYYLQEAKNILKNGHPGTELRDGVSYNMLRLPPEGRLTNFNFLSYINAYSYKLVNLVAPSVTLESVVSLLPLIFALLSTFVIFLIVSMLSNPAGGFFASMMFALHPGILATTSIGYSDTNALNIFFSLLIVFLVFRSIRAFEEKAGLKTKIIYCAGLVLSILIFKLIWKGYYYILVLLFVSFIVYLIQNYIVKAKKVEISKKTWMKIAGGGFALIVAAILFLRSQAFEILLVRLNIRDEVSLFPTGFNSISELQEVGIGSLMTYTGKFALLVGLIGFIYFVYKAISKVMSEKLDFQDILLPIWFAALLVAGISSMRFMFFYLLPLCILAGMMLSKLPGYSKKAFKAINIELPRRMREPLVFIIVIVLILLSVLGALNSLMGLSRSHSANDGVYETASFMRSHAEQGSMIYLWWDWGYVYEYYSEMPVLFDGGSFSKPRLYWFSKALVSDDENMSRNLLHMLACTGEQGFEDIAETEGELAAIDLIEKAFVLNQEDARQSLLSENISEDVVDSIFCRRPVDFIVINEQVRDIFPNIETFAGWNFTLGSGPEGLEQKIYRYTTSCEFLYEEQLLCGQDFIVNTSEDHARHSEGGKFSYILAFDNMTVDNRDIESDYVLIVYGGSNGLRYVLVKEDIVDSLFIDLIYLKGSDLTHFTHAFETEHHFTERNLVYTVDYD